MAIGEALPKGCRCVANVAACAVSGVTQGYVALREADAMAVVARALALSGHGKLANEAMMALGNIVCKDAARLEEAQRRGFVALVVASMLAAQPTEVHRLVAGTRVIEAMWHHSAETKAAVNTADGNAALKRAVDATPPPGDRRLEELHNRVKMMVARLNPLSS